MCCVYSQKDKGALQPSLLSLERKSVTKACSKAAVQQKSTEMLNYNLVCLCTHICFLHLTVIALCLLNI